MSKINILALGGLDEKYKNMYVLEVDSKIYIIDAGVYEPLTNSFGIEHYIPKLDYIVENKDKVKAVFLSSGNRQQIGALPQLVKLIPNIKIYGSEETIGSLGFLFGDEAKDWNTEIVKLKQDNELSGIKVRPISLSASIPGTLGYIFKTNDGNIVYFTDYIFDSIEEYPFMDLKDSLTTIASEKNLLFMSDSLNAFIKQSIAPNYRVTNHIKKHFKTESRIIASVYEDDIINIVELLNLARENKYKVAFADETFAKIIKLMQSTGKIDELPFKSVSSTKQDDKNLLIIATGTRTDLYSKLDKILEEGFNDTNSVTENDIVAILSPPQAGNEDHHQDISNKISRIDPTLIALGMKEKLMVHPSQFDLKNYLMFLQPKYFMPIKGFFKEMKSAARTAESIGMDSKNIILADSGEIFSFDNGVSQGLSRKVKEVGNTIIEKTNSSGLDSSVLIDRTSLGKDGLLTLSILIKKDTKELLSNLDIQMKGVVFVKSQDQLIDKIEQIVKLKIAEYKDDWKHNKVVSVISKELSKTLRAEIKKVPLMVIQIKEI